MHGAGAGAMRGLEDPVDPQIAVRGRRGTDEVGFVCGQHVGGRAIGLRIHGDAPNAQLSAGADDPKGDLTSIRDQNGLQHQGATPFDGVISAG